MSSHILFNPLFAQNDVHAFCAILNTHTGRKKEYYGDVLYYLSKCGLLNQPPDLKMG